MSLPPAPAAGGHPPPMTPLHDLIEPIEPDHPIDDVTLAFALRILRDGIHAVGAAMAEAYAYGDSRPLPMDFLDDDDDDGPSAEALLGEAARALARVRADIAGRADALRDPPQGV